MHRLLYDGSFSQSDDNEEPPCQFAIHLTCGQITSFIGYMLQFTTKTLNMHSTIWVGKIWTYVQRYPKISSKLSTLWPFMTLCKNFISRFQKCDIQFGENDTLSF